MALLALPVELLDHTARFITTPADLLALLLTCRTLHVLLHPALLDLATTHAVGTPQGTESVLLWAARNNRLQLLRLLVEEKGMSVDPGPIMGDLITIPIIVAGDVGNMEVVEYLEGRGSRSKEIAVAEWDVRALDRIIGRLEWGECGRM